MDEAAPSRRAGAMVWISLIVLVALALAGWRGWSLWQAREVGRTSRLDAAEQRIAALEARLESVRGDMRAQAQRINDGSASNRVLRDEVMGLGQRGALLEDTVSKLSDSRRSGPQALRLDEVELLLSQAAQRLQVADDAEGARRAYALAEGVLQGINDPRLLNLKQALAQERATVDALGAGRQAGAAQRLDAFRQSLHKLPSTVDRGVRPTWQKLISPLVEVRPSQQTALAPAEREAAQRGIELQLTLAQAALERGDDTGFDRALAALDSWLPRVWPSGTALTQRRTELKALQAMPLRNDAPELGSTLQQLRAWRSAGHIAIDAPAQATPATGGLY